jgi:N-acetylglucosamine-6-phosphate deacetylase
MNAGTLEAMDVRTRRLVRVEWSSGLITRCDPLSAASRTSGPPPWIAPPLTDLQVNGFAGTDFQSDAPDLPALLRATEGLRRAGCTRFLLTLITDDWNSILGRLARLRRLRESSPDLRRAIMGWHIEGPFLSSQPGFCGAHEPARMIDPTPAHLTALRGQVADDRLLITLAPERPGAIEAIRHAVSIGITVSLGHTDAPAAVLAEAVAAGATGFTHLGNGCPQLLDRHDNIILRVLNQPGLRVGFIPDGIHVPAGLLRVAHRALPAVAPYYVSDAMSAAGAPPGKYPLGRLELEVGADQVVRRPGSPLFAGSALRPVEGVFRAARMLEGDWQDAWLRFSDHPARWMGLNEGLRPGDPATFCVLHVTDQGDLASLETIDAASAA